MDAKRRLNGDKGDDFGFSIFREDEVFADYRDKSSGSIGIYEKR